MSSKKYGIEFLLRALGEKEVADAFKRTATSAVEMGGNVSAANTGGAVAIERTQDAAKELDKSLSKVGQNESLSKASGDAEKLKGATKEAASEADILSEKLDKARNWSAGIAAAGVAGLILARNLSEVAAEGDGVLQRLESILRAQGRLQDMPKITEAAGEIAIRGHYADDDDLNEAAVRAASFSVETQHMAEMMELAARQARTMRGELTNVADAAEALSKAYNTGQVGMLKKQGVTVSDEEIDRIEAAYAISQKIGQAEFMNTLGAAIRANTVILEDSLTDAQKAANDTAREMDNLQTSLGQGVQQGEKNLAGIVVRLLQITNLSPSAAQAVGQVGYYASLSTAGIGSMATAGIQAYSGLIDIAKYYGVTVGGLFSSTFWAARWATFAAFGVGAWTSITTATVTAGAAAWAAIAPLLPLMLAIVAAALLAAAAFYAVDKLMNAKEDKELRENIAKGDATDEARLKMVNDGRKKHGKGALTLEQMRAWENDTSGEWKDPTEKQQTDADFDIDKVQKQYEDMQAGKIGAVPVMPNGAPATANIPVSVAPSMIPASVQSITYTAPTMGPGTRVEEAEKRVKRIEAEIEALQDQKFKATERKKPIIEAQIREAKKRLDTEKEKLKADQEATKTANKTAGYELDVQKVRSSISFNARIDELEDARDIAKEDADDERVRALTLQIEALKAQKSLSAALSEAAAAELSDPMKAASMREIAELNYGDAMREAKHTAAKEARQTVGASGAKKKRLSPSEIARIFAATGASGASMSFPSLGTGIDYGNRFAGAGPSLWDGEVGGGYQQGIAGVGDFGVQGQQRRKMDKERKIRVKGMTENSKGERVVKFVVEDLVLPPSGFDEVMI